MKNVTLKGGAICLLATIGLILVLVGTSADLAYCQLPSSEKHEYLIITNKALFAPFLRLSNFCNNTENLNTVIYTTDDIKINYPGADLKAKIRNFIKDAYKTWGIKYVLLGGDTEIIPAFYMLGMSQGVSMNIPTDMYYAGLDGDWQVIINGRAKRQQVDMDAEVCVGRAPVNSNQEANNFVDKTIRYKTYGKEWQKNVLLLGECIVPNLGRAGLANGALDIALAALRQRDAGHDIWQLYDVIKGRAIGGWDKTLLRNGGNVPPDSHPDSHRDNNYFSGVNRFDFNLVIHFGHGNRTIIMRQANADVASFTNSNPFLVYSLACYSAAFDGYDEERGWAADRDCAGEKLITAKYGAVALIGNSRGGIGSTKQILSGPTIDLMYSFVRNMKGKMRLGEVLQAAKKEIYDSRPHNIGDWEAAIAELNLLGDPTLNFDISIL